MLLALLNNNIWHQSNLEKYYIPLKKNGFCLLTMLKDNSTEIGLKIEILSGATGKWEMFRDQKVT